MRSNGRARSCASASSSSSSSFTSSSLEILDPEALQEHLRESVDLWSTSKRGVVLRRCEDVSEARYWLQYMPMRNRAEVARLMLEYAEVPYALEIVGYKRWMDEVKPTTEFGKTPSLLNIDGNGKDLSHEQAIARFLGRELGLAGADSIEEARVDELFQQYWCTIRNNGLTHDGALYSPFALAEFRNRDDETSLVVDDVARFQETHRVNDLPTSHRSLQALRVFEEILESQRNENDGDDRIGLVGNSLTYVDFALLDALLELREDDAAGENFHAYLRLPRCGEFLQRFERRSGAIAEYVRGSARVPRYQRPGYNYVW